MIPPAGPSGYPTVSTNQLRIYGAGGFRLVEHEAERGCPRQYKARYIEKRVPREVRGDRGYALDYGSYVHDVFHRMERDGLTPDEALEAAFPAHLPPEAFTEARDDVMAYMERGAAPMDRYGTLEVEATLDAELYVDPEFGPIHFRGIVDWLGIDLDDPSTAHVVDYKTNRSPPREEDVRGDVQMKGYDWLVRQHMSRWGTRRVVVHLDAVKWREVEVRFTEREIDDWHSWAVAVVRKILRDDTATPVLNPGCDWCPVKDDCPVFIGLPETAAALVEAEGTLADPEVRLRWRDAANKVRLLLEKSVKRIDEEFRASALRSGGLVVADQLWSLDTEWSTEIDLDELQRVLGRERFLEVVATSESKLKTLTKDWSASDRAEVLACVRRVPTGSKVKRKQVE